MNTGGSGSSLFPTLHISLLSTSITKRKHIEKERERGKERERARKRNGSQYM
jgi:hypothetical protein